MSRRDSTARINALPQRLSQDGIELRSFKMTNHDQRRSISPREHGAGQLGDREGRISPSIGPSLPASRITNHADLPPRPRSRSLRSSLGSAANRLSLTPLDMQFSADFVRRADRSRVEETIGTRERGSAASQSEPPAEAAAGDPVDLITEPMNGKRAWITAMAAILVVFNCWGFSNAFGLFHAYYQAYYLPKTAPSTIAWIGSTQLALCFGLGVPIGRAVDNGHFALAFQGGSAIMIVGLFCSSYCSTWLELWLVQGLMTGFGMGCVFCSGLVALMSWFDGRRMGAAMGLAAAGSCLGGIVYILIARHFLVTQGFGATMRILSGLTLATMIIPAAVFRMRREVRASIEPAVRQTFLSQLLHSLRLCNDGPYILAALGMFWSFLGLYFGFVYLISFAVEVLHVGELSATNILIYMLAVNLPGRLIPAMISDHILGPHNTMIVSVILSSVVLWIWVGTTNIADQTALTVIACMYGLVSGGIQGLYAPLTYSFCLKLVDSSSPSIPQVTIDRIGMKAGGIFSCIGLAVLLGTPVGGELIDHNAGQQGRNPFLNAQYFAAASMSIGALFLGASRGMKSGWTMRRA